jgi:hypothetical protein
MHLVQENAEEVEMVVVWGMGSPMTLPTVKVQAWARRFRGCRRMQTSYTAIRQTVANTTGSLFTPALLLFRQLVS